MARRSALPDTLALGSARWPWQSLAAAYQIVERWGLGARSRSPALVLREALALLAEALQRQGQIETLSPQEAKALVEQLWHGKEANLPALDLNALPAIDENEQVEIGRALQAVTKRPAGTPAASLPKPARRSRLALDDAPEEEEPYGLPIA